MILFERLRLHLDERELDLFLDVGFGALDRVEHLVQLAAPGAFLADAAHLALDFGLNLATTIVEHLLSVRHSGTAVCAGAASILLGSLHDRRSFRPGPAGSPL